MVKPSLRGLLLALFSLAAVVIFLRMTGPIDFAILDTRWNASTEEVYRVLGALTPLQTTLYRQMLLLDYAFALAYGAAMSLAATALIARLPQPWCRNRYLTITAAGAPAAAALLDVLENTLILRTLALYPRETAAGYLGTVTSAKWILVGLSAILLLATALLVAVYRIGGAPRRSRHSHGSTSAED